jgi:hypothetical protein
MPWADLRPVLTTDWNVTYSIRPLTRTPISLGLYGQGLLRPEALQKSARFYIFAETLLHTSVLLSATSSGNVWSYKLASGSNA